MKSGAVYCKIQIMLQEGVEMLAVLNALCQGGRHPPLGETFRWMQTQVKDSIKHLTES